MERSGTHASVRTRKSMQYRNRNSTNELIVLSISHVLPSMLYFVSTYYLNLSETYTAALTVTTLYYAFRARVLPPWLIRRNMVCGKAKLLLCPLRQSKFCVPMISEFWKTNRLLRCTKDCYKRRGDLLIEVCHPSSASRSTNFAIRHLQKDLQESQLI